MDIGNKLALGYVRCLGVRKHSQGDKTQDYHDRNNWTRERGSQVMLFAPLVFEKRVLFAFYKIAIYDHYDTD